MQRVDLEQGSSEWLQYRDGKIGSSDAPIIMGVSPWCTPLQLWERKIKIAEPQSMTAAMRRGHAIEQTARDQLEFHFGVGLCPAVCQSTQYPWQIASLDAICDDGSIIVEIKAPGKEDHALAAQSKIPLHYVPQLQHIMAVTGAKTMFYYSYSEDGSHLLEVDRNDSYIEALMEKELSFYEHLMSFTPPDLSPKDVRPWDPNEEQNVKRLASLLKARKQMDDEIDVLQKHLKQKLVCTTSGFGLKAYFIKERSTVDYSSIPELANVNLDEYRRYSMPTWGFKLED